jgi:hypothetical protein
MQSGAPGSSGIAPGTSEVGANTTLAVLFIGACAPYRTVMAILTQRDHVDDETPQRGHVRIAGSAIAPRLGRFADCSASAGVRCHTGLECPLVELCGDRYWGSRRPPYY